MTITFGWSWWQYFIAVVGAIYAIGFIFFVVKGWGIKFALAWPIILVFAALGLVNVQ